MASPQMRLYQFSLTQVSATTACLHVVPASESPPSFLPSTSNQLPPFRIVYGQDILQQPDERLAEWAASSAAILVEWAEPNIPLVSKLKEVTRSLGIALFAVCDVEEADHIAALVIGADGILIKPISPAALQARLRAYGRIRALEHQLEHQDVDTLSEADQDDQEELPAEELPAEAMRNLDDPSDDVLVHEPFALNLSAHTFHVAGRRCRLTKMEFDFMAVLLQADGLCCSREDLFQAVWNIDFDPGTNAIDAVVYNLRRKLRRHGADKMLQTVRGVGFRLNV